MQSNTSTPTFRFNAAVGTEPTRESFIKQVTRGDAGRIVIVIFCPRRRYLTRSEPYWEGAQVVKGFEGRALISS